MQLRESRNISTKTTRLEGDPKKFAALLLAGAMALLMLTACGGGGGSVNKTEEQKVMSLIKDQKGAQVTSDAQLRAKAEEHLQKDMNGGFQLGNHKFFANVYVDAEEDDYAIVTVTASYVYSDTLLSALLKAIETSTKVPIGVKGNVKQNGTWSKVGIVILSDTEQSYIGLSIRVENPHK